MKRFFFILGLLVLTNGCQTTQTPSPTGLTRKEVVDVIRGGLPDIRKCYVEFLSENPGIDGRVKTRFIVSPVGKVIHSSVTESTISNQMFTACVTSTMTAWKFPAPKNATTVTVNYPFTFSHQ